MLKGLTETGPEEGFHQIQEVRFSSGDKQRVLVRFRRREDLYSPRVTEYRRGTDSTWRAAGRTESEHQAGHEGLDVSVKQGLNEPPLLIARNKQVSRVIWDPNPQLKDVELGSASIYTWKDKTGREWSGGLFKPHDYKRGQRYPLVIQTHGFTKSKFIPSGIFPTAFAARTLAADGMVVLQVANIESCLTVTIQEASCVVSGYEAAAKQLVMEGLVDPERIGIIGFSRSCYYVMETLTVSPLRLRAASVTDGVMGNYLEYLTAVDSFENNLGHEYDSMIGAQPFGDGLQQWLKRSPGFNLDKINTPLMIVAFGPAGLVYMWEPYAGLRICINPWT